MKNAKKVILIILAVIILILTIDFILMFGLKKTPLFAININSNKDGVSNEYYGLGYKTIFLSSLFTKLNGLEPSITESVSFMIGLFITSTIPEGHFIITCEIVVFVPIPK